MRVAYIVPGSGGGYYCENCLRDATVTGSLGALGFDILTVPLYLPLFAYGAPDTGQAPLFYGAIALYLRQQSGFFRRLPAVFDRLLNARPLLALAARAAGSTRAAGLEEMTISMLLGEEGGQAAELERLSAWLAHDGRPEIVHLSNALLLGMAPALKERLGARIVCSLQDEHVWIEPMGESSSARAWELLAAKARFVDRFIAVSDYYRREMIGRLGLSPERVSVVPLGVDTTRYLCRERPPERPVIGFLSRIEAVSGLDLLVEALGRLVRSPGLEETRLEVYGGMTADDRPYLRKVKRAIRSAGLGDRVSLVAAYRRERRFEFLHGLSALCVPRLTPEASGMYLLEALSSGVPVVAPDLGGLPEIVAATGGGLVFPAGDKEALTDALRRVLSDRGLARELSDRGCERTRELYSIEKVARQIGEIYRSLK